MLISSARLFIVHYFSVRSSRLSTLRYGWRSGFQCPESSLTKKAARTEKRSILTILRKNMGRWTVYYATKQNKKKASFDCAIDGPLAIVNSYGKLLFSNLYSAGNLLRVQLAKPKFLYSCSFVVLLLFMRNHFQVNPFPLHNFVPMVLTINIPVFQYMLVMFRYRFLLRHCVYVVVV